jgi:tetratricopeptide (TPR) repeat protein
VGSEAQCVSDDGEIVQTKQKAYAKALAEGRVSLEMFDRAIKETRRADYEELGTDFEQAYDAFQTLDKVIDEKFGDAAPNLSAFRSTLREIRQQVSEFLARKRLAEPDRGSESEVKSAPKDPEHSVSAGSPAGGDDRVLRLPSTVFGTATGESPIPGSWQAAEALIRSGNVDEGLARMTRLAADETTGRDRFHRKLLLANVCVATNRERLARSILQELAEQIDKYQLESWESTELIAGVWSKLYQVYRRNAEDSADSERADKLYERLCRLDPWQALACSKV